MDIYQALLKHETEQVKNKLIKEMTDNLERQASMAISIRVSRIKEVHLKAMTTEVRAEVENFINNYNLVEALEGMAAETLTDINKELKQRVLDRLNDEFLI